MSTNEPPPPPPPSGPPPTGYGAQPTASAPYSPGAAWKYGWEKFTANLGQVLIAVLVLVALNVGLNFLGQILSDALIVQWVFSVASWIISLIIGAGIVRFALDITEGRELSTATVLTPVKLGDVIVVSVLTGIATFIGLILCVLPGIAVAFFTSFSFYFLLDRPEMGAIDAIKASFRFTTQNAGSVILWFLLSLATFIGGALLCGVGLIVAIPVVLIGTAYTYKTLTGQPVAA